MIVWELAASLLCLLSIAVIFLLYPLSDQKMRVMIPISILLIVLPVSTYLLIGNVQGLQQYYQAQDKAKQIKTWITSMGSPNEIIDKMKQRLASDPNSAKGWYLLARLYDNQNNLNESIAAYRRALALEKTESAEFYLSLALYKQQGNQLQGEPEALLRDILATSPNQPDVLLFYGEDAMRHGQSQKAIQIWMQLRQILPDPEDKAKLTTMINQLQSQGATDSGHNIAVTVSLDPSLAKIQKQDASVFIYAKAVKGPAFPLAVIKKSVSELPLTVVLSRDNAMQSTATLDDYTDVVVTAKVSFDGNATTRLQSLTVSKPYHFSAHPKPLQLVIR